MCSTCESRNSRSSRIRRSAIVCAEGMTPSASSAPWIEVRECAQAQMPQMRLVMCCASKIERPRSSASKKRGASTTSKRQASSAPSLTSTTMLPCPSTRVRYSTRTPRFLPTPLAATLGALLAAAVVQLQPPDHVLEADPVRGEHLEHPLLVGIAHQAAAAVADVAVVDAPGVAAGAGHRAEAGHPPVEKADVLVALALRADRLVRHRVGDAGEDALEHGQELR